ncbi:SPOR domain-containing protein [Porphyrobacter sp. TH134]|uniref:tetratricopeptide repeat protein n=1 Tax=Porphyrobacter sp. TH134 TaxID=2067450 RepID=UPI000C7B0974|nr:tetratricopeptide repeat protein [Porphyrobacter sp. TH134]PLK23618.1 SPOR domain-containing protein [Porphyrobacter sp. TH134]
MDRSIKTGSQTTPRLALAVTTALASIALSSCATNAAPRADVSFGSAQTALAKGQVDKAIMHAEAAVLAEPRNPGFRALLGAAYLEAGRFASAATSFNDALDLGDDNPRTVLSFALAKIALGEGAAATAMLDDYAQAIDPADLGLALALGGQPERGVHVLINAVRASEAPSPKLRQNLAYTYALAGNWRLARVMAAEDVPADQLNARLSQWAAMSAPEQFELRIATMLGVSPRADSGQPQQLALANFPSQDVMVAEAASQATVDLAAADMPGAEPVQPALAAPSPAFAQAFAAPEPEIRTLAAAETGARYVSNPVVQQLPAASAPRAPAAPRMAAATPQRRMAATAAAPAPKDKGPATHLVQLGSYTSKVEAERGWTVLKGKFPQLKDHKPVITEAVVNGRTFWRVAAAGFGANSAKSLCGTVKSAGRGCFAYAASSPPAGAIKRDVQMASRSR